MSGSSGGSASSARREGSPARARSKTTRTSGLSLDGIYTVSARSHVGGEVGYRTRGFAQALDKRKDARIGLGLDWKWNFTPTLAQTLGAEVASQSSNRGLNEYKRHAVSYGLGLTF